MKGFIIDATYKVINDKAHVLLFGRSEKGESFLTTHYTRPFFYIKEKDLKKAQKIGDFDSEKTKFKNFDEENVVKIILDIPSEISKLKKAFEEKKIETFEADIIFARRFLIDHKIQGGIEVIGDFDLQEEVQVYREPKIKPAQVKVDLKILSVDIETDPKAKEIYCISMAQDKFEKVLIRSSKKLKKAESFEDEEDVLERFLELVKELDPDIITGWNFIDFDLKVIRKRCQHFEIPFNLGKTNKESRLIVRKGFFASSKMYAEGRQVLDTMHLIKDTTKLENYRLETASQHFVKEGKLLKGKGRFNEIEELFANNHQKLVDYNLKDSILVLKILEKSNVLALSITRSKLTGLLLDQVKGNISSLDCIYLKRLHDRGYVAPSVRHSIKEEPIKGGYVMDSKPGIYSNIVILDFKSLYPSIMRTFNIDPLMFGKKGITAPNGATFSKEIGIMPQILEELWTVREEYRKKKDEVGRYAIKILMNSFFGAMASPLCRFYNLDLANSITYFAEFLTKETANMIQKEGFEVIYSDTDSCFVVVDKNPKKVGKELEKKINLLWDKKIKKEFKINSFLELEFEKVYTKFIMPKLRGSEKGAKKRYAGLVNGKLEITGLEAVRGDWTKLAQKFQKELLMKVFEEKEVGKFVSKFIKDLEKGKYDELLVYKKSLRKPLKEYVKTTPPHVKAARQVKDFKGKVVEYVYTDKGVELIGHVKGELNYKHYITKQIKPLADAVLVFYDLNFNELLSGQKDLFSF
jgi:DNA polymerase II